MLFYNENDFDQSKFIIDISTYAATYENYYSQYRYLIDSLVSNYRGHYVLNATARGTLFLMRHTIELLLKANISEVLITHNINDLLSQAGLDNTLFANSQIGLDFNSQGDSLKYYFDNNGNHFPNAKIRVDLTNILAEYNQHFAGLKYFIEIDPQNNYSKPEAWNLTFCLNEANSEGIVAHEYEVLIEKIFNLINSGKIDINACYIPIYFLIRHSIEISFKVLIKDAREISEAVKRKDIDLEHSLVKLLNVYDDYLSKVNENDLEEEVRAQLVEYRVKTKEFISKIHEFDNDSIKFRFPIDKFNVPFKLNVGKYPFWEILVILKEINVFLKFTNAVLEESDAHVNPII